MCLDPGDAAATHGVGADHTGGGQHPAGRHSVDQDRRHDYADYTYQKNPESTDTDGNLYNPSSFNVSRTYLNITGNISHVIAFRITPDITRDTDAGPPASSRTAAWYSA